MAIGKLGVLVVFTAVFAVFLNQYVVAQNPGTVNVGDRCATRASCNATQCENPLSICCDGRSFSMASDNSVRTSIPGRCQCCKTRCMAGLAMADNEDTNADAYSQFCSKITSK